MQIPCEVLEGSGADTLLRFQRVPVQMPGEVLEGSGAGTREGSGKFGCRCFGKFQRVPMFLMAYTFSLGAEALKRSI